MKAAILLAGEKFAKWAVEYIKTDQNASYGLTEKAEAVFSGDGIGIGLFEDDVLRIDSVRGGDVLKLTAKPFSASLRLWNGPDVIPNGWQDGSMEASLWHDLIWSKADKIALATGLTRGDVLEWANGILHAAYIGYGERKPTMPIALALRARVAFQVCELGKHIYHPIKRVVRLLCRFFLLAVVAVAVTGCGGCSSPPDWEMDDADEMEITE